MDDVAFRIATAASLALFFPIGAYYRARSHTGEPLRRRDEGLIPLLGLRILGLVGAALLAAYLIDPETVRWSALPLPVPLRWSGLPLLWISLLWGVWMFRALGRNLTDTVNVRANAALVTHGPYCWVRHPMYLGVAGLTVALGLLTANALLATIGVAVTALLLVRARTEESKLEERFGDAYRAYRSRTGFFLPRLRSGSEIVPPIAAPETGRHDLH